jgi:hypothetical protein
LSSDRREARGGVWHSPLTPNFLGASLRQSIAVTGVQSDSGFRVVRLTPSFLEGDFNENGAVNAVDLGIWRSQFGTAAGAVHTQGNADGDGDVDDQDFLIWQRQFGIGGSIAAVPEPTTGALAICLAARAARMRLRQSASA